MRMTPCRGKPHHSSKSLPPEGRKVGSLKRRVRSQLARWEMKNCTPLWREAHLQVKMCKARQVRTTFGSWDVEKVHAAVAQRTFRSQNVQNTPPFSPLLEVEMLKKCTPLWREAHFQVKMHKTHHSLGPLLEVQMSQKCTPLWREAHFQVKMYKSTPCRDHFWRFRCRFGSLHYTTLHLHFTLALHSTTLQLQLHSTTLHYTPLHSTKLHCTTIHYTTLQYNYLPLHFTTLHYTTQHYAPLHYKYNYNYTTTLHYTPLH